MPLFHDPDRRSDRRRQYRRSGEELEHNQAPGSSHGSQVKEGHQELHSIDSTALDWLSPSDNVSPTRMRTNDRQELIQQIKESSPWRLQYTTPAADVNDSGVAQSALGDSQAEDVRDHALGNQQYTKPVEELGSPADIQRPRSALHSGDFNEGAQQNPPQSPRPFFAKTSPATSFPRLDTSSDNPWLETSAFQTSARRTLFGGHHEPGQALETRSRAPSLGSFSSSYVLKAPTSPLVHQANNTDLDFSPRVDSAQLAGSVERANRRRTLPPECFRHLETSPPSSHALNFTGPSSPEKQDGLFHQYSPRRTLTSAYSLQLAPTGNAPAFRVRRPSLASEISPKPHAPMVGSYEESLLRGRMSMNPSKPLDFTAQVGVLGKGKCKGHLKCPPHVTVPFPAVFYSYPTSGNGRSIADDSPSPYVGQIDLENSLSKEDPDTNKRRKRHHNTFHPKKDGLPEGTANLLVPGADTRRRREKKSRRNESPKCPPGGCYRIPQQGQLQIIIKNPNKTAVKLFLVPYDLTDMESGTKTFIRQRSYSAGPIIDMPLEARRNYGTDRPEASLNATANPHDKPTLRYLIHLNICCPARGRFYLHSSMRVVFANRVPDGKEKLRNEIQLPEPRYSPYKPTRDSIPSTSASARLAIEKASRRRSVGQGTIPLLRAHVSSPSDAPMDWTASRYSGISSCQTIHQDEDPSYSKLNQSDAGYDSRALLSEQVNPDTGESVLAKKLRGLDVHRQETFDGK